MMRFYVFLKDIHNKTGMLVLALVLLATIYLLINLFRKNKANKGLKVFGLIGMIAMHFQILLGFILYFLSPLGLSNFSGHTMGIKIGRFYIVEHPIGMILAAVLISLGYRKIKKTMLAEQQSTGTHIGIFIFYLLALAITIALIPWFLWD